MLFRKRGGQALGLAATGKNRDHSNAAPVPSKTSVCGVPLSLSLMLNVPVRDPDAAGVKVTMTVQVPDAASVVHVLPVTLKSPLFVPVMVADFTETEVVP